MSDKNVSAINAERKNVSAINAERKNVSTTNAERAVDRLQRITGRPKPPAPSRATVAPEGRGGRARHAARRHRRRQFRRRRSASRLAVLLALVALTTAALAWSALGRRASPAGFWPVEPGSAADPRWPAVVQALDRDRQAALSAGDEVRLARVYAPGSPAWERDAKQLRQLAAESLRPRGQSLQVRSVHPIAIDSRRAVLRVVDSLPGYDLVDPGGRVAQRYPGRGPVRWWLTLARADPDAGWRIYDVTRATAEGADRR